MMVAIWPLLFLLFTSVLANTEKTIFLGPKPVGVPPPTRPTLADKLLLHTLTPANRTLRTRLPAQFPAPEHPQGTATWLILDNLTPNQRYEVRVCWAATQPTEFTLSTFPLATVWNTRELLVSLYTYSTSQGGPAPDDDDDNNNVIPPPKDGNSNSSSSSEWKSSMLFLRVLAAADYFTTDAELMRDVPPVHADIILDPFLFNVLPRSLVGTVCYIVVVAVGAYFLAGRIASEIQGLIASGSRQGAASIKKTQ